MKIPWPRFLSTPVLRGTIGGIVFFASGKYRKNVGYGGLFESLRSAKVQANTRLRARFCFLHTQKHAQKNWDDLSVVRPAAADSSL